MKTSVLFVATSSFALMMPGIVMAQSAETQASDSASNRGGIVDIVVTAQRRSENVQRASIAIDVVTGDELARNGVTQAVDLTSLVPGLQLAQVGATAQPFIRGVGNASNTGAADSGVAFSVDGVFVGQPIAYGVDYYDLARVEVLKGPQGTLYGRNATGGAINLITNMPGRELEGTITAEYGNYDRKRLSGGLTVPLGEEWSARLAFNFVDRDGFFRDGSGDDEQQAARLKVLFSPEGGSWLFNVSYAHVGGVGGGYSIVDGNLDGNPANGVEFNLVDPRAGAQDPALIARYNVAQNKTVPQFIDLDVFAINSQIDLDLSDKLTFTAIPAYRKVNQRGNTYPGFRFTTEDYSFDQLSLETRLNYESTGWKWVVGGFLFDQSFNGTHFIDLTLLPPGTFGPGIGTGILNRVTQDIETQSYSAFGETSIEITPELRLIAGARYTHESSKLKGTNNFFLRTADICSLTAPCLVQSNGNISANNFSWKAGAEFDVGPQSMLFATVATGFKAGGVFPAQAPRNSYKPEKLMAITVGSRNRFLDNRLQVNVEAFYWDYKNKQETIGGFDSCGGPICAAPLPAGSLTNLTLNAGKARIYGVSVDAVLRATPTTTIKLATEYTNSEYTSFDYTQPTAPNTGCTQMPPAAGNPFFTVDCSGFPLTRAPKWSGMAAVEKIVPLGDSELVLSADISFASSRYIDAHFLGNALAPSYQLYNADITYRLPGNRLSLTAYIKNIGDTNIPVTGGSSADFPLQPFTGSAILMPPRTYGLRVTYNF
ncbi:TonB-dependent receptor [Sphingobium sp. MK2]|uniref:TonB-dependent receptor n=1 Tax=Sphingobium sp. MK2 TaxID=3116540 RepID=UPI0032E36672